MKNVTPTGVFGALCGGVGVTRVLLVRGPGGGVGARGAKFWSKIYIVLFFSIIAEIVGNPS